MSHVRWWGRLSQHLSCHLKEVTVALLPIKWNDKRTSSTQFLHPHFESHASYKAPYVKSQLSSFPDVNNSYTIMTWSDYSNQLIIICLRIIIWYHVILFSTNNSQKTFIWTIWEAQKSTTSLCQSGPGSESVFLKTLVLRPYHRIQFSVTPGFLSIWKRYNLLILIIDRAAIWSEKMEKFCNTRSYENGVTLLRFQVFLFSA